MTREAILSTATKCVTGDRQQDYGTPENNFSTIAKMWEAYMCSRARIDSIGFTAKDVAAMLACVKLARIASGNAKDDNWIDLAGYAACGGEIESDMRKREEYRESEVLTMQSCSNADIAPVVTRTMRA